MRKVVVLIVDGYSMRKTVVVLIVDGYSMRKTIAIVHLKDT